MGWIYGLAGRDEEAIAQNLKVLAARLERMSTERDVTPTTAARICLGLDDRDCLCHYLEKGFQERSNFIALLSVLPWLRRDAAVRSDPRFQGMFGRLGYQRD